MVIFFLQFFMGRIRGNLGKFGQKLRLMCFDLKKCAQKEMKCSRFYFLFFGDHNLGIFSGQVWGNLGKNPSHSKNLPAPAPMILCLVHVSFGVDLCLFCE